jgi:hypothetical protein
MPGKSSKTAFFLLLDRHFDDNCGMDARASLLLAATPERWIALSEDDTRIIAEADTFEQAAAAAEQAGEPNAILMLVPPDWSPRIL